MCKSLYILIGLLLTNLFPLYGQHPIDYKFGFTGGVNAALIQNSTGIQNIRWRYNLGLAIEQRFSPALGLVYQINYSRQGETVNLKYGGTGPVVGYQFITFDYVNMAIMARFRPKSERIFIQLGGQLGLLVNDYILVTDPFNQGKSFENVNKLDVGVTGGLGYRFGRHIVIDTRYYHGLKPILSDFISVNPQTGISTFNKQDKWYNRVYSLNLSYYF